MAPLDRTPLSERLRVAWWAWPSGLTLALALAVEISLGAPGLTTWLPITVLTLTTVTLLLWLGRIKLWLGDEYFHVDDAKLPFDCVGEVEVLNGLALKDALSVQLHPLAFVIHRPWIKSAIRITVNDTNDPTPYWIISTRRADEWRSALTAKGCELTTEPHPSRIVLCRTIPAYQLAFLMHCKLTAVVNQETTRTTELIVLHWQNLDCQFLVSQIRAGKLKVFRNFDLVNIDTPRLSVSTTSFQFFQAVVA